jgi:hypothetical protein
LLQDKLYGRFTLFFPPFFTGMKCYPSNVLFMLKKTLSLYIVIPVYN